MNYLLLCASVFLATSMAVFSKLVQIGKTSFRKKMTINLGTYFVAFATIFFTGLFLDDACFASPFPLPFLFAFFTIAAQISLLTSVELGSVSISTMFYFSGFLIPSLWGSIYYGERINIFHIVGLVLVFVSMFLTVKKTEKAAFNFKWLIAALGGLFFSGMLGVTQKILAREYPEITQTAFLNSSFALIILMCIVLLAVIKIFGAVKNNNSSVIAPNDAPTAITAKALLLRNKKRLIFILCLGCVIGVVNRVNTYLSGALPSIIMFPVTNGGTILLTTLCSGLIFKETLSKREKLGMLVMVLAIMLFTVAQIVN